jgi:hypothetical protein
MKARFLFLLFFIALVPFLMAQQKPLQIIMIGAHPDDCDIKGGGTASLCCGNGA